MENTFTEEEVLAPVATIEAHDSHPDETDVEANQVTDEDAEDEFESDEESDELSDEEEGHEHEEDEESEEIADEAEEA